MANYACITDSYLNLKSRQAYHFAIVDAFLCENQNNNHISLRLKGGAAAWQRALRAEFMAEVLRLHHFSVTVTGDLLNAWSRGLDQATGAEKLTKIGYLLRFSAQLDLWMTDPDQVKKYVATLGEAENLAVAGTTPAEGCPVGPPPARSTSRSRGRTRRRSIRRARPSTIAGKLVSVSKHLT